MVACGRRFTTAHGPFVNSRLGQKTVVFVGFAVHSAHWPVVVGAVVVHALALVLHGDSRQLHVAQVFVGFIVGRANVPVGLVHANVISALAPGAELLQVGEHDADVAVLLPAGRAHWVVLVRAEVGRVEVGRTSALGGHRNVFAVEQALVAVCDSVHAANGAIFVGAVGTFADFGGTGPVALPNGSNAVQNAAVLISLAGDGAHRQIIIRTVGAVRVGGALAVADLVDSRDALHFALGVVRVSVTSANSIIVWIITITFAVVSRNAPAKVPFLGSLASHQTFVIVGYSIGSANGNEGFGLGAPAVAEVASFG